MRVVVVIVVVVVVVVCPDAANLTRPFQQASVLSSYSREMTLDPQVFEQAFADDPGLSSLPHASTQSEWTWPFQVIAGFFYPSVDFRARKVETEHTSAGWP